MNSIHYFFKQSNFIVYGNLNILNSIFFLVFDIFYGQGYECQFYGRSVEQQRKENFQETINNKKKRPTMYK